MPRQNMVWRKICVKGQLWGFGLIQLNFATRFSAWVVFLVLIKTEFLFDDGNEYFGVICKCNPFNDLEYWHDEVEAHYKKVRRHYQRKQDLSDSKKRDIVNFIGIVSLIFVLFLTLTNLNETLDTPSRVLSCLFAAFMKQAQTMLCRLGWMKMLDFLHHSGVNIDFLLPMRSKDWIFIQLQPM